MGAPKGNNHNKKWTIEEIDKLIFEVYDYVVHNIDCVTIAEAITVNGQYEAILRYFKTLDYNIDFTPIKKAKDIIKYRIINNALKNEYNNTMSIFILKNNHDMKDKTEVDQNIKTIEIPPIKFIKTDDRDK